MGECSRSMQAYGALPEAAALGADPRPAWIWSADGGRILWANAAGGRRLGARSPGDLDRRRYSDSHPLRRDLQNAVRLAGPDGAVARLRLLDQPRAVPIACRVRRIAAPDGGQGILVVAEAAGRGDGGGSTPGPAGFAAEPPPAEQADSAPAGPGAVARPPPGGAVRSPIPDWLRARLATYPASAGRVEAGAAAGPLADGSGRAPQAGGLSAEERAAFAAIAAALGPSLGTARPDPAGAAGAPLPAAAAAHAGAAEARLSELALILDIATDGVAILDGEGRIRSLNGGAEALLGRRQADVAGRPFAELLAPHSRTAAIRSFAEASAYGRAAPGGEGRELEAMADGRTVPLRVTFGRIANAAGRYCAVLHDLTKSKQVEAELVAARRKAEAASSQKSDFLARVSHEIRTPLNGIIGFADVILEERFGPLASQRYREYVRDIRTSGEHVLSLVNDLLDIAKIEAGKLELSFATVELNQLVRECVMLMQPAAGRARIILRTSLAADLPGVRADARTVRQVALNILSNAVKFSGPGGQVIVSTGRSDGGVVFKVRDTGDGMSEAELARALEPFRQLATAPLGDRTGTGLGLPLTKALVEANRASFAISSAKGEGTIVKVAFPAAGVAAASP